METAAGVNVAGAAVGEAGCAPQDESRISVRIPRVAFFIFQPPTRAGERHRDSPVDLFGSNGGPAPVRPDRSAILYPKREGGMIAVYSVLWEVGICLESAGDNAGRCGVFLVLNPAGWINPYPAGYSK